MSRIVLVLLCVTPALLFGSDALYEEARRKIDLIAEDRASRGSTIYLSVAEVNALVEGEIREEQIEGVTNPKVVLGDGRGTWSGVVDFSRLSQLENLRQNFLLRSLLKGTSPVAATILLTSGGGQATIDVEEVEIGETAFKGRTLAFLVEQVVLRDFPNARIGEPFELEHDVEKISIHPQGIRVKIRD